ncbi:hypothetical protein JY651_05340 [Pyxidicoccus parkwayensis]|uniref:Lipoprotein n=1 Tax=Pyxidicoccus parkwayensis TaxID=2813578 RepID=A0ABX7NZP0_9BACT|nr:hypothetical protein [Pyxidicoccus parkwaysis]QSQ24387.1 hypothetical protein JY651_05340 [Pyxidicoccus parkwaysis]
MTSSSRASRLFILACTCAALTGCAEEPRAMANTPSSTPPAATPATLQATGSPTAPRPVELRSVEVKRVRGDAELSRMAGEGLLANGGEPVAIEVRTAEPLGNLERSASPEIYVNGARLGDTWALGQDRLVVIVPEGDLKKLQDANEVTVAWLGAEQLTRSRTPLRLDRSMLP